MYYHYYDKVRGVWDDNPTKFDHDTNHWAPTGVVYYDEVEDSSNKYGVRYDAHFYITYGKWTNKTKNRSYWKMIRADELGYWWPEDETETNWNDDELIRDTFYLWPMVFLVDHPPFVNNGVGDGEYDCDHTEGHLACTAVEINYGNTEETVMGGEFSAGAYVKTGEKSPLTFEFNAGLSGAKETGISYSLTSTDTLEQSPDGHVMAFFMAPQFKTTTLQWYKADPTGIFTYPIKITGISSRKFTFNPTTGPTFNDEPYPNIADPYLKIPLHAGETDDQRMATYVYPTGETGDIMNPDTYENIAGTIQTTWASGSPNHAELEVSIDGTETIGCYADLKIGATFVKRFLGIGGGLEASLEINYTSAHEVAASVETSMGNPPARQAGDINNLQMTSYWLKPNENGYWNPQTTGHTGDKPSFVTFSASTLTQ